ncbi:sensor protein KdpD [compost metagenome]
MCVDTSPRAERLIRRGFRIAHRLKAPWHVHYVHNPDVISDADNKRLDALRQLSNRLGGNMEVTGLGSHKNVGEALLQCMKEVHATQLIIGQSRRPLWYSLMRETVVHFMLHRARWVDMLIVADFNNSYTMMETLQ